MYSREQQVLTGDRPPVIFSVEVTPDSFSDDRYNHGLQYPLGFVMYFCSNNEVIKFLAKADEVK